MAAQNIEYVEFYAADKQAAADYFTESFGFTQVARSSDHGRDSVLLRQGPVQMLVTGGPAVADFIGAHGDGIADIALSCDDVAATRDAAVKAGAGVIGREAGRPVVTGFGDVRHTLLPATAHSGLRLPPGRAWTTSFAAPTGPAGRIHSLDHVAVCLTAGTMAECVGFYTAGFGLARYSSEYIELGDQAMDSIVVRSPSGGVTFTLLEPDSTRKPGQIDAFLDRNCGPGVQHLAFGVDDIIAAVAEYRGRGVTFLSTPATYYDMLAERLPSIRAEIAQLQAADVLADRDEWGHLLQLFTRSPYERNTLFYELIQRRGAQGFGSANIRALYEAVERDRLAAG